MKYLALSFVILGFATAQACPVINGKFEKKNPDGSSIMIGLQTRIADNVYQYNFDVDGNGPFLPADGIARNVSGGGDTGTLRISCEGNWVQFEAKVDGGKSMMGRFTLEDNNHVRTEEGLFTRK